MLGVDQNATQAQIEKAYRQKALQYHPDRNPGDIEAHKKFIEAQAAYDTLKDQHKRQDYDQELLRPTFNTVFDIFDQENLDIKIIYKISIIDTLKGGQKDITLTKKIPCDTCKGFGATSHKTCDLCYGSGHTVNALNSVFSFQTLCGRCLGNGKIPLNKCEKCHGIKKINTEEKTVSFVIPKGLQNNMTLCLNGQGNIANNGRVGNVYVQCVIEPHPIFKIEGLDLVCNVKAKYSTMLFGGKIEIPTAEDDVVEIQIPAKTECLTKLRVKNKGMYDVRNPNRRGDVIAHVLVDMPSEFSDAQKVKEFLLSHGI